MSNKKRIEMSALGRPFSLGSLYSYVDDSVLPNIRLWYDVPTDVVDSREMNEVEVYDGESDTAEKAAARTHFTTLGIDQHSAVSLTTNLVQKSAKGAWRYGADRVDWSADPVARRADAAVYCRRSTKKKWLTIENIKELRVVCYSKELVKHNITHVVVAIIYGAEAFCLFSTGGRSKQMPIQSNYEADAASITKASKKTLNYARCFAKSLSNNKCSLGPLQDEEGDEEDGGQSLVDTDVLCTLYSSLQTSRSSCGRVTGPIVEQFDICRRMLREPLKKSTPLKVWLHPIKNLYPTGIGKKLVSAKDVPLGLAIRLEAAWSRLLRIRNHLDLHISSSDEDKRSPPVLSHQQNMNELRANVDDFARRFCAFLSRCVTNIRQGASSKSDGMIEILAGSLDEMESRPELDPALVARWLTQQRDQLRFLKRLATLPGVAFVCNTKLLKQSLKKLDNDELAVVLHLPSLAGRSSDLVSEMALLAKNFDPLEERPFETARPAAQTIKATSATSACLDEEDLFEEARRFSSWVMKHNQETEHVRYVVSCYDEQLDGEPVGRETSAFTRLYEYNSRSLNFVHFELPQVPGRAKVEENRRGVLTISWDVEDNVHLYGYLVQYCSAVNLSTDRWESCEIQVCNRITLTHLQSEDSYVFRVATLTAGGRSPFGQPSLPITVDPVCRPPANLQCGSVTDTSVEVTWVYNGSFDQARPFDDDGDDDDCLTVCDPLFIKSFLVEYWVDNLQHETYMHRLTKTTNLTLEPLSAGTAYCIQVRAEYYEDSSSSNRYSPPCTLLRVETLSKLERLALRVRKESRECSSTLNVSDMPIFQVPLNKQARSVSNTGNVGRYRFGEQQYAAHFGPRRQRTILLLGATGSGKTTLINAMINYILGIEWEDDFRFKLIDEGNAKSQAHSQTDLVTTYDLYERKGSRLKYSLTVIDTPGFGDTRGVEADREIMDHIGEYFQSRHGVVQLEAVCFVVQSVLARLTATQQYIFDSILSIFGEDIKDNIRLMVTFADVGQPPMLGAIKEANIPTPVDTLTGLPACHKFNNSIFFESKKNDEETDEFNKTNFTFAIQSFDAFFCDLGCMEAKSLKLTREVLEERRRLEALVVALVLRTEWKLTKNDELQQVLKLLNENKDQMEANKESEFEVEVLVPKSIDISRSGQFTTNCQKCTATCHFPCRQSSDENKHKCSVMDPNNGNCMVCGCHWSVHFNQKYRYEIARETIKWSSDAIFKQYLGAKNEAATHEQKVAAVQKQIDENEKQFNQLMMATFPHINRLNEIALRPHVFSASEYIDVMINNENQDHKPGYQQRIVSLQKVRKLAEMTAQLLQNNRTQPIGEMQRTMVE